MPTKRRAPSSPAKTLPMVMLFAIVFFLTTGLIFLWKIRFENKPSEAPAPVAAEPSKPVEPTPQPAPESAQPVEPTSTAPIVLRLRPPGQICDDGNFICVSESYLNAALTSPFVVTGTAVAFEQQFAWKLEDANGNKIGEGSVMTHAPDAGVPGPFEMREFLFHTPKTATGKLALLEYSAKDGSPIHVLTIPVKLPTQSMTIKLYGPEKDDLSRLDCTKVLPYSVTIAKTRLPIEASLRALLAASVPGPGRDLLSSWSLVSLVVSNGVARAEVEFQPGIGGSCYVQTVRAMIESTLKQFSSVKSVVITEKGKTPEQSLQP